MISIVCGAQFVWSTEVKERKQIESARFSALSKSSRAGSLPERWSSFRASIEAKWWWCTIVTAFLVRLAFLPLTVVKWAVRSLLLLVNLNLHVILRLVCGVLTLGESIGADPLERTVDRH